MKPRILKSQDDYSAALAKIERLMDAKPGSAQEDRLELWSLLVEHYEKEHLPIDLPDPVDAIRFQKSDSKVSADAAGRGSPWPRRTHPA
jgi:HTH-type transcriptional regulator / antitoxin HigA